MTAVLFGDIEKALVDYLDGLLTPPVRTRIPSPRPAAFFIVQRLGGPKNSVVTEQATVTFESWANKDETAHDNAQLMRQAVHNLPGVKVSGVMFYKVAEFAGPARLPDPTSAQPRFVFTASLSVRGT